MAKVTRILYLPMTQNTIQFQRGNPLQSMVGVARAIALPHEYPPTRFPSFPALERTAVVGFNANAVLDVPATGVKALVMRQAAFPVWTELSVSSTAYALDFVGHDIDIDTPVGTSDILLNNISRWDVGTRARSTGNGGTPGVTAGTATGSGYPILAVDMATGPREWFYVGKDWTVGVSVSRVTPYVLNDSVTFYLERWERPGEITTNTGYNIAMTAVAGNTTMGGTVSPAFTGWYRISKANNDVVPIAGASLGTFYSVVVSCGTMAYTPNALNQGGIWTVTPVTRPTLLPITAPVEFATSSLPWESTRLTAVAMLATNVTKALNKEGTILAGRLAPANTNVWTASPALLTSLHPAEKAFLPLEWGTYSYCPPSTDLTSFWDYTLNTSGGCNKAPLVRLDNDSLVNMFGVSDPDGATSLALNIDYHLEFRTSSALFQIGLSTMTLESLHQAQLSLVSAGFFFSNEDHKRDINAIMHTLGSWLGKAQPYLKEMHPVLGAIAKGGQYLLSNKAPTSMKPTTLNVQTSAPRKSGGTRKKKVKVSKKFIGPFRKNGKR
jgi:hypothetical protein